jgi:hypothetical protein
MGEAEGAVAGGGVGRVAAAIVLERFAGLVMAPAVGLDEDALVLEDEVDLVAFDVVVHPGLWQAGLAAEGEEALFEL